MKIGFICDMHLPEDKLSSQFAFFKQSITQIKEENADMIITAGDITACGEWEAFENYKSVIGGFKSFFVIGNSDVRDNDTKDKFIAAAENFSINIGKRKLLGINTPYGQIEENDKECIQALSDGDILIMHHGLHRLDERSREFVENSVKEKSLTIIHAHSHMRFDYEVGKTRVIGLRALDGDKSIGDFPCVTYFDITDADISFYEKLIEVDKSIILDAKKYFGMSCVDNHRDVKYAIDNNVKNIELRCNGADWYPDMTLLPLLDEWREKTGGYLSVHMPNVYWRDEELKGEENWYKAVDYAKKVKADGLTIHPPRVKKFYMEKGSDVWNTFLNLYTYAVTHMNDNVKIGIENLHMEKGEGDNNMRAFGYTPMEVSSWIDAINEAIEKPQRVGHLLDVGHARNNGFVSEKFPISRWYNIMGNKTVAYHIHQVVPRENGLSNHQAIEDWFGPVISYASFFYAWGEGILNHVPIFLEVGGCERFEKSIRAFEKAFGEE